MIVPIILLGFICASAQGQERVVVTRDTIVMESQDSALLESYARRFNPGRSLLLAAVVPGLGQVYNKKYWKLPLVYGGFYLIGRQIGIYNDVYREYKGHLYYNLENGLAGANAINPATEFRTRELRRIVDRAQRERDFFIILMGAMYILQIVDAHVDSHLKEFDLNPNLQVRIEPVFEQNAMLGRRTGLGLVMRF